MAREIVSSIENAQILTYLRANGKQIAFGNTTRERYFLMTKDRQVNGEIVGITTGDMVERTAGQVQVSRIMRNHLIREGLL